MQTSVCESRYSCKIIAPSRDVAQFVANISTVAAQLEKSDVVHFERRVC